MRARTPPPGEESYAPFFLAASIYIIGVIAFSFWSYRTHRNMVLTHTDITMNNTIFTAREILGSCPVTGLSNTNATNYILHKKQLSHLAQNNGFIAIAAVSRHKNETQLLIRGSGGPTNETSAHIPLPHGISQKILELSKAPDNDFATLTTEHPDYGQLRVAILYTAQDNETGVAYLVAKNTRNIDALLRRQITKKMAEGLFLIIMAIPLISLYNRIQKRATEKLAILNTRLKEDVELQKLREAELTDAMHDLKRFSTVAAGRESRIIELKNEVNELLEQHNQQKRYSSSKTN